MVSDLKEKFSEDGFVILEDFFTPKEVEEMRLEGDNLVKNMPEQSERVVFSTGDNAQHFKDTYFLESGDKVRYFYEEGALSETGKLLVEPEVALNKIGHYLHMENDVFRKITFDERIKEICYQLGFEEPAIAQSMYIFKNPGLGGEVVAHQDASYLHTEPVNVVGFWIALDDATIENGCLRFARGSHKSGVHRRFIRNPNKDSPNLLMYDKPAPTYQMSSLRAEPVPKGSCVLIHGQVVHYSEANKSKNSRNAYTFHVIERKDTMYSKDNWLQPNSEFPSLYKN